MNVTPKKQEKRTVKGYKVRDSVYKKAMKKVKKGYGVTLAELLELVVDAVANDARVEIVINLPNQAEAQLRDQAEMKASRQMPF